MLVSLLCKCWFLPKLAAEKHIQRKRLTSVLWGASDRIAGLVTWYWVPELWEICWDWVTLGVSSNYGFGEMCDFSRVKLFMLMGGVQEVEDSLRNWAHRSWKQNHWWCRLWGKVRMMIEWWWGTGPWVQKDSVLHTNGAVFYALGELIVVGGEFSAPTQPCKMLSMLPCLNRGLFADACHIKNTTGLFIILKFWLQNNFGKMPLCEEGKPRIYGRSGKNDTY